MIKIIELDTEDYETAKLIIRDRNIDTRRLIIRPNRTVNGGKITLEGTEEQINGYLDILKEKGIIQ